MATRTRPSRISWRCCGRPEDVRPRALRCKLNCATRVSRGSHCVSCRRRHCQGACVRFRMPGGTAAYGARLVATLRQIFHSACILSKSLVSVHMICWRSARRRPTSSMVCAVPPGVGAQARPRGPLPGAYPPPVVVAVLGGRARPLGAPSRPNSAAARRATLRGASATWGLLGLESLLRVGRMGPKSQRGGAPQIRPKAASQGSDFYENRCNRPHLVPKFGPAGSKSAGWRRRVFLFEQLRCRLRRLPASKFRANRRICMFGEFSTRGLSQPCACAE